jgi:RNA polymerase sigma-70 factor (ECF subfamily)
VGGPEAIGMRQLPNQHTESAAVRSLMAVESFESFFRREFPSLVTLAYALSGSREAAEDIAQDAMLAAYKRWDEIVQFEQPAAYVRRSCANLAVSSMRRRWAESRALVRLRGRRQPLAAMDSEDARFWTEVRRLPSRQAQAVALHYGCDLAVADVATAMDTSEGSVKQHLHRARATLARRFGDEVAPDIHEEMPR